MFQKTNWMEVIGTVKEGAGWYTAAGVVEAGGKPFVRIARGQAVLGGDPETNAPVKQAQKLNIKTAARARELIGLLELAATKLEEMEA